jgi:hypothetical protein
MPKRAITLRAPVGGLYKRLGYQQQPPFTSPDASNVRSDSAIEGRERIGSRPGLSKAVATQLGSGNPVRMLGEISYITGGNSLRRVIASSNGLLYRGGNGVINTFVQVSSSLTLASDRSLMCAEYHQKLFIADYGGIAAGGTNGTTDSTGKVFDSGSYADWTDDPTEDINANDYVLELIGQVAPTTGAITGVYSIASIAEAAITLNDSAGESASNIRFRIWRGPKVYDPEANTLTLWHERPVAIGGNGVVSAKTFDSAHYSNWTSVPLETIVPYQHVLEIINRGASNDTVPGIYDITEVASGNLTLDVAPGDDTGVHFRVWDTRPKGSIPIGNPIIERYRDRLALAGSVRNPQEWAMSRMADPDDWYFAAEEATGAVAGTGDGDAGQISEPITCMVAHNDDCLLFSGKNTFYVMRSDPNYGGQVDRLSDKIGALDRFAWCETSEGWYVFLSVDGLYAVPPGCGASPMSISREKLPEELLFIDPSLWQVHMDYDVRHRGIHLYVTKISAGTTTHYWIDIKTTLNKDGANILQASFWPVSHHTDWDAFSMHGYMPAGGSNTSEILIGGRDGYVRQYDQSEEQDNAATAITSYVEYGPLGLTDGFTEQGLDWIEAVLGNTSGAVDWAVRAGDSPEEAFDATALESGTWELQGMNYMEPVRLRGMAHLIRISNGATNQEWSINSLRTVMSSLGAIKR